MSEESASNDRREIVRFAITHGDLYTEIDEA